MMMNVENRCLVVATSLWRIDTHIPGTVCWAAGGLRSLGGHAALSRSLSPTTVFIRRDPKSSNLPPRGSMSAIRPLAASFIGSPPTTHRLRPKDLFEDRRSILDTLIHIRTAGCTQFLDYEVTMMALRSAPPSYDGRGHATKYSCKLLREIPRTQGQRLSTRERVPARELLWQRRPLLARA